MIRCSRCVSDTTMAEITFNKHGICNFCELHDRFVNMHPLGPEGNKRLSTLLSKIKKEGENKTYDCIVGLSGGADSTALLHWAVQNGLKPLAVSFDNGWSTDIAVKNIRNATEILGVELHTIIADWEEMKDLQRAFLKASVSDADAPTDYAIYSILYKEAISEGVRFSLNGHSFRAEGTVPKSWSYFDGKYVKNVISETEGCFITSYDPNEIASSIEKVISWNKRTNGRKRITHLDNKIIAKKIYYLYKSILNHNN